MVYVICYKCLNYPGRGMVFVICYMLKMYQLPGPRYGVCDLDQHLAQVSSTVMNGVTHLSATVVMTVHTAIQEPNNSSIQR